jgi:excisionase family DNA binding protein
MENQIIEIQNTVESIAERMDLIAINNNKAMQIAIDTMQAVSRNIADNDDSLYTVAQTSKILGLSSHIIREEIKENKLKAIQRGSRNYVRKDDLNEYIKTN